MGSKISIDKHVSNIEDILEMNPAHFSKLKFENNIPTCITQHIKIWRYYEDDRKSRTIKSAPLSLKDILSADFNFVTNECYLVLFVYKKRSDESSPLVNFPHSIWGVVESSSNLTPRGLETPVANSESISSLNKEALESFLLPKRPQKQEDSKFEYMLFVWNGKTANPLMKAVTLSAAIEFDALINKAKDPFLQVLFSGGYVRNKKLWMGKILQLDSSATKDISQDFDKKFEPLKDTVYLLKFLFPGAETKLFKPNGFKERFLRARGVGARGDDEYVIVGGAAEDVVEDEPAASEDQDFASEGVHVEDSPMVSEERRGGESDYSDEPPLPSARGHVEARPEIAKLGIPKFNIPAVNVQNTQNTHKPMGVPGLSGLANLASNRNGPPALESNRGGDPNKQKPKMQGFNLGNLDHLGTFGKPIAKLEINQNPQISDPARSSLSQERSNEDPPMSSGRTSESHDSRLRTERRGLQPIPQRGGVVPPLMNIEPRRQSVDDDTPHSQSQAPNSEGEMLWEGTESEIRVAKIEYYGKICSTVLEDFLYVAGQKIAYNETKLKEIGITHIINMAGDACENMFPEKFNYLTYYAKDSKYENIECLFYETASFIEEVKQQNGRVLVHCVQGVSRSVAICMSYLILKHEFTFGQAYQHLRDTRGIASPNSAFWAQLYNFQLRISGASDKIPTPRVYSIGSFQKETPQTLVARLLYENSSLYNTKAPKYLDPRGVFILQSQDALYLWIGNEIHPANKDRYIEKAEQYIELLQQYEGAPGEYSIVHCGEEPKEFWHLWKTEIQERYGINEEWDYWFVDLASHENVVGTTLHQEEEERTHTVAVTYTRPALYSYPELEPNHRVEMDELIDENLLVLCVIEENHKVAYLWRGGFVPPEIEEREYLANVLSHRWPDTDPGQIRIKVEQPDDESDTFINYFE